MEPSSPPAAADSPLRNILLNLPAQRRVNDFRVTEKPFVCLPIISVLSAAHRVSICFSTHVSSHQKMSLGFFCASVKAEQGPASEERRDGLK